MRKIFIAILLLGIFFVFHYESEAAVYSCCYHECNLTDPRKCENNKVMECRSNCDDDRYQDWCEIQDCSATSQTCQVDVPNNTAVCSGTCNASCNTGPGCRASLANGHTTAASCCGSGSCYTCDNNYTWNGSVCAANCTPACTSNAGCNDSNNCTTDVCNNANTCTAACAHNTITACVNNDNCCPTTCTSANDNDCTATADTTNPTVNTFTAVVSGSNINISYTVADTGGSHLDRVEIWRTPDNSGTPGTWAEVATLRHTITTQNLDSYTRAVTDMPGNGTWWYGIHVIDQSSNMGTEATPTQAVVTVVAVCAADGCNANCPANCTVTDDPDCGCQGNNACCGIGCTNANDSDCTSVTAGNKKLLSKYNNGQIFLIADDNWQEVMSLVSLTTWTAQEASEFSACHHAYNGATNTCAYPTLIYHKESDTVYDADSILYFIEQYSASEITAINSLPNELTGQINGKGLTPTLISTADYLSYWDSYDEVVYVQNNYQLALLASTFASLKNAPLIIEGTSNDTTGTFSGKIVYRIGSVLCPPSAASCHNSLSLENLEAEYLSNTNTNRIVLVNYNDLNISLLDSFSPQYSSNSIQNLYSRHSLVAPFLSAAKQELIISTQETGYQNIDSFLENKINSLFIQPRYLTILASPESIPMSKDNSEHPLLDWQEVDYLYYANIDNDDYPEIATGRIFSLTSSDVSSYVSRSLFYNKLVQSNNFSMLWPNYFGAMKLQGKSIDNLFFQAGFQNESIYYDEGYSSMDIHRDMEDKFYINYLDHGYQQGYLDSIRSAWFSAYNIWLNPSLIMNEACLTCAYDQSTSFYKKYLYCAHTIRRGAIMNIGAVEEMYNDNFPSKFIAENILKGEKIGDAMLSFKKAIVTDRLFSSFHGKVDNWYVLLGDPTFYISNKYPAIEKVKIEEDVNNKQVEIIIPEVSQRSEISLTSGHNDRFYLPPAGENVLYHAFNWAADNSYCYYGDERYYISINKSFSINNISQIIFIDKNGVETNLSLSNGSVGDVSKLSTFNFDNNFNDYNLELVVKENLLENEYELILKGNVGFKTDCSIYNSVTIPAHSFKITFS